MMNLKNTVTYNQFHKPTSIVEGNIYGETGIVAILVKTSTSTTDLGAMYYVHTDHLGSYSVCSENGERNTGHWVWERHSTPLVHSFTCPLVPFSPYVQFPSKMELMILYINQ